MRRVKIWWLVTFAKPMILTERDLYYFSGINFLMTFLYARSTACYLLKIPTSCSWVLTSLDKITDVEVGSGMTRWMPRFFGTQYAAPQWVLNTAGCAVKIRHPNVPRHSVQLTADENEFRYTLRLFMYSYVGTPSRGTKGNSINSPKIMSSSGVKLMLISLGQRTGRF